MGVTITSLGDLGYDHEGYVANGLDTGEWTGTTSPDTRPRMTGSLRAQCACGWHADRVWASDTPAGQFPSDDLEAEISTTWEDHIDDLLDVTRKHRHTD